MSDNSLKYSYVYSSIFSQNKYPCALEKKKKQQSKCKVKHLSFFRKVHVTIDIYKYSLAKHQMNAKKIHKCIMY